VFEAQKQLDLFVKIQKSIAAQKLQKRAKKYLTNKEEEPKKGSDKQIEEIHQGETQVLQIDLDLADNDHFLEIKSNQKKYNPIFLRWWNECLKAKLDDVEQAKPVKHKDMNAEMQFNKEEEERESKVEERDPATRHEIEARSELLESISAQNSNQTYDENMNLLRWCNQQKRGMKQFTMVQHYQSALSHRMIPKNGDKKEEVYTLQEFRKNYFELTKQLEKVILLEKVQDQAS
jgi:hypothetical protein